MGEFRMPSLGADMTEGTLVEWLVGPGDHVHHGQIVAVIDTVKSAIDIEAFEDGEIERLLVEPGTTVTVGTPLAAIRGAGPAAATEDQAPAEKPAPAEHHEPVVTREPAMSHEPVEHHAPASPIVRRLAHEMHVDLDQVEGTGRDGSVTRHDLELAVAAPETPTSTSARGTVQPHVAASPRARRRATELGVDLAAVTGTGAHGAVTMEDVELAAHPSAAGRDHAAPAGTAPAATPAAPAAPPARGTRTADVRSDARKDAMQAATAALMARSKKEIPHYYLESVIDLRVALDWLARHNDGRASADRVLPAALLLLATARSLLTVPELNGFYTDGRFEAREHVDLGMAVSLRGGGLVVANLREAETKDLDSLMAMLKDVATRARAGRLTGSEMSVPTVTVTNLGDQGADLVHGVIYPPQVALVGFGRIVERPWAVDGMLTVRPLVTATLAADHRVTDGHRGSRFLAALDAALQKPEEL
jgi:pyruvate dehydrogenase E2 component (dihydrolipoamide acetyltransferase)